MFPCFSKDPNECPYLTETPINFGYPFFHALCRCFFPQKACAFRGPREHKPILLCCHDKVGIGESNPGGHERKDGASVNLRTSSGPQATERGAKEEACERGEAGGQSPMGLFVRS